MNMIARLNRTILVAVLAGGLAACAAPPGDHGSDHAIDAALSEGITTPPSPRTTKAAPEPPAAVNAALLPQINLNVPGSSGVDVEPRFDVKVNRSPARSFFMGLVEGTPYNMIVHPQVQGHVTLDLKNVTIPQVMNVVRNVYGYDYERHGRVFEVYPNAMRTRIFKINYLDMARKGESQVRVSSGQVTENPAAYNRSGSNTNSNNAIGSKTQALAGSNIETTTDSNFWRELRTSLQAIVGNKDGRRVVVSPQSGIVVVRAMPDELRDVEQYLRSTQAIIQRQVILEAKIIEVDLNKGFQSGVNWAALGRPASNKSVTIGQVGGGSIFGAGNSIYDSIGTSSLRGNTGDLNPSGYNPVNGTTTSAFGGVFTAALNLNDFTAFIELLQTQGKVHVLSSPRVSTVNNQKAVIKVGTDEFFVTDVNSNTNTTTGALSTQNNVTLTPFFSGVALDVLPQIDAKGDVILHIHPTVSEVKEQIKNISVSTTQDLSVPLANSTIRESDSIVRAESGQVVVIGGLMQNTTRDDVASVPLLGDLPLVGGLFRHTKQVTRKSELVILLRPIVVNGGEAWSDMLRGSRQRIRDMGVGADGDAGAKNGGGSDGGDGN